MELADPGKSDSENVQPVRADALRVIDLTVASAVSAGSRDRRKQSSAIFYPPAQDSTAQEEQPQMLGHATTWHLQYLHNRLSEETETALHKDRNSRSNLSLRRIVA